MRAADERTRVPSGTYAPQFAVCVLLPLFGAEGYAENYMCGETDMCGIIGYTGVGSASAVCYEGLKRLEYRGYDSAGIAVLDGGRLSVFKRAGKVCEVQQATALSGHTGVGHTRWATHGRPSGENAHPHRSGKFAVVHNGMIENYAALREELEQLGYSFVSETDTEAIAHLINSCYRGSPSLAVRAACSRLKGSYALAVLCEDFDGIVAVKYKSPLIVGFGEDGNYVASDVPALAGRADRISILNDGDMAVLTAGGICVYDRAGRKAMRRRRENPVTAENLSLCGYPHYMIKEINETPAAIRKTAAAFGGAMNSALSAIISGVTNVVMVGCGTAYNSGLAACGYFGRVAHLCCRAEQASEFRCSEPWVNRGTLIIAISQSGETADTVGAAKAAKRRGAKVIAVTNVPYSAVSRAADCTVPVLAGTEVCVAATKSYAGQIAALYMLACAFADTWRESERRLSSVARGCEALLTNPEGIERCARLLAGCSAAFFLGRGADFAAAREASLKLKEVTYIFSDGYAAGELKHGTLALVDENTVSVVIVTQKKLAGKCENAVEQIVSRGGKIAVISNVDGVRGWLGDRGIFIPVPKCGEKLSAIYVAVATQLLAYRTAVLLGRNPDKPRNLAKSVTVE